jgi:hypothetical protein
MHQISLKSVMLIMMCLGATGFFVSVRPSKNENAQAAPATMPIRMQIRFSDEVVTPRQKYLDARDAYVKELKRKSPNFAEKELSELSRDLAFVREKYYEWTGPPKNGP